jgi:Transketolase
VRPDAFDGSYIHYGVREHAMAAAMNGIALHGGFIPMAARFSALPITAALRSGWPR